MYLVKQLLSLDILEIKTHIFYFEETMSLSRRFHCIDKVTTLNIHFFATGVGEPLSIERSRSILALRINVLAKGYR